MSENIDVVSERVKEHDRRIDQLEDLARETSTGASALLVVTERHSEQISTLTRVIYSGMFLAVSSLVGMFFKLR